MYLKKEVQKVIKLIKQLDLSPIEKKGLIQNLNSGKLNTKKIDIIIDKFQKEKEKLEHQKDLLKFEKSFLLDPQKTINQSYQALKNKMEKVSDVTGRDIA